MNNGTSAEKWRQPYDFGKPFDNRRPAKLGILQESVLDGRKTFEEARHDFIISIVVWALHKHNGNITQAAKHIGMNRTTLSELWKKYRQRPHLLNPKD